MSFPNAVTLPSSPDLVQSLRRAVREALESIERVDDVQVDYLDGNTHFSLTHTDCPSLSEPSRLPVRYDSREYGELIVRTPPESAWLSTILQRQVDLVMDNLALESTQQLLLNELAASWESLQALYELGTGTHGSIHATIQEILALALTARPQLRVALWRFPTSEPELIFSSDNCSEAELALCRDRLLGAPGGCDRLSGNAEPGDSLIPISSGDELPAILQAWDPELGAPLGAPILSFLETLGRQLGLLLENECLNERRSEQERLEHDLDIGSRIQNALLTVRPLSRMAGLEVATVTRASQKVDGDFIDFHCYDPFRFDLLLGDVMGKGIGAALGAAALKLEAHRSVSRLSMKQSPGTLPELEELVTDLHTQVTPGLIEAESFTTFCWARFDRFRSRLETIGCGHPPVLHVQEDGRCCDWVESTHPPLGIRLAETFCQKEIAFSVGDLFIFFSDGVSEVRNARGDLFGLDRIERIVLSHRQLPPRKILDRIHEAAMEFQGSDRLSDDFTCVAIRIDEQTTDRPLVSRRLELMSSLETLGRGRQFLRNLLTEVRSFLPTDLEFRLTLGCTELLSNIIRHAYPLGSQERISIVANLFADRLVLRFYDWGSAFTPSATSSDLQPGQDSQFGLYLINNVFDSVSRSRGGFGRNCTRVVCDWSDQTTLKQGDQQ